MKKDPYISQVKNKTSIQFKLLPYKYTIIVCNTYNNSRCFITIQKVQHNIIRTNGRCPHASCLAHFKTNEGVEDDEEDELK